jgi:tetratricopeptide (TPR) repeat protein
MSPEQSSSSSVDGRSDIYSFCLSLREAVTGGRTPDDPKSLRSAPAWLERILVRGERLRPEDRWPTMRALLDALARGPAVTPLRLAAGLSALAIAAAMAVALVHGRPPPPCAPDPRAFADVWDDAMRTRVEASFRAADPSVAAFATGAVDRELSRFREEWIAMRVDSCAATQVRREQSEGMLDLRTACLDGLRRQVRDQVQVFLKADASIVAKAPVAVAELPRLEACANVAALSAIAPRPDDPTRRAAADEGERQWETGTVLFNSGKTDDALVRAEAGLRSARSANYLPLEARLLVLRATILRSSGAATPKQALEAAHEAAMKSLEARDDASAAAAWLVLSRLVGGVGADSALWADYAEASIRRLGGDDALEAERLTDLAAFEEYRGHFEEAREQFERARPLFVKTRGPDYYRIAAIDDGLGTVALFEQRLDDARRLIHQGRLHRARVLGPTNGQTLISALNEQDVMVAEGRYDEAAEVLREVDPLLRTPTAAPWVGPYLDLCWGIVLRKRGAFEAALERDERSANAIAATALPDDANAARPLSGEGQDLLGLKRPSEAIVPLEDAVARFARSETPERAEAIFALARALDGARRDPERAVGLAQQARTMLEPFATRYHGQYQRDLADIRAWLNARGDP